MMANEYIPRCLPLPVLRVDIRALRNEFLYAASIDPGGYDGQVKGGPSLLILGIYLCSP